MTPFVDYFLNTLGIGCGILAVLIVAAIFCLIVVGWIFKGNE